MILSVDTETWNAAHRAADGTRLPYVPTFHPQRALDAGVRRQDLVLTTAITLVSPSRDTPNPLESPNGNPPLACLSDRTDPSRLAGPQCPSPAGMGLEGGGRWLPFLGGLRPGDTMVFRMHIPEHRRMLCAWLARATILLGMNLPYDLLFLRSQPDIRPVLSPSRQFCVDLSHMNYFHSEIRPERSLKNIVSLFNLDRYDEEESLKDGHRYRNPNDRKLLEYNARDTHNTVLSIAELARRMERDHPGSDKCSDWCMRHYSGSVFLCTHLAESGVPFSEQLLQSLETDCLQRISEASRTCGEAGLICEGEGSVKSKTAFMTACAKAVDDLRPPGSPSILSDSRVVLTKKKKEFREKDTNREVMADALPHDHPLQGTLAAFDVFSTNQKLVSTYTFPLLRGPRKQKEGQFASSKIIAGRAYPSWFPTPGTVKDGRGESGGTEQGRMTCKAPPLQTLPPKVKKCIVPNTGRAIIWIDLSQIELRVAALLSGEWTLIDAFLRKADLHSETAVQVYTAEALIEKYPVLGQHADVAKWPKVCPGFSDLERQCGKHGNFTVLNLGGPGVLQRTILKKGGVTVPFEFCKKFIDAVPTIRPSLYRWQMESIERAKREHIIRLPICGISRYISGDARTIDETYRSMIVNCPIQTWAGLLMREYQLNLMGALAHYNCLIPHPRQIINIYDCTAIETPTARVPDVLSIAEEEFQRLSQPGGLWHMLEAQYGVSCPIAYEAKVQHADPTAST